MIDVEASDDPFSAISDSPSLNYKLTFPTHQKNSLRTTVISYVCTTVGAGIISLPLALAESGWLGVLLIALTAVVCVQTANWLIACMYCQDEPLTSYEAIGVAAMGKPGKIIVAVFQNITLFGVCCIFLIIAGGNLSALIPSLSMHAWVLIVGCVLIPVSWLKTVKEIKPLAYFGLFASLLVGLIIVMKGLQTAATTSVDASNRPIEHDWLRWSGISTCINIVVFSLGSHSVMPNQVSHTVRLHHADAVHAPYRRSLTVCAGCVLRCGVMVQVNEMQHAARDYKKFTISAYALISSIYIVVAACGYAGYGRNTADNVLNSIDGPDANHKTHVLTQIARLFITAHVLLAYPLPLNPVSLFMEDQLRVSQLEPPSKQLLPRIVLRSVLVVGTMFIASVVPYFGSILSLVSALSIIASAFVLPPVFYYLLHRHQEGGVSQVEMVKMAIVVVVGIGACVIGVYFAISGLIADIRDNPSPFEHYWG